MIQQTAARGNQAKDLKIGSEGTGTTNAEKSETLRNQRLSPHSKEALMI